MTSSAPPTTFAVLNGKYKTGAPIISELMKQPNVKVRIGLSSGKPVHPFFIPLLQAGAYVYSDQAMKEMLTGVDVLLCYTASKAGLEAQMTKILDIAVEAGVKLFIPCENSLEFESDPPVKLIELRRQFFERAAELKMPTLRVVNGLILENFVTHNSQHPFIPTDVSSFNWQLDQKKVHIIGSGNVPASVVPISYVASWLVNLLTTTPLDKLQSLGIVYLEGETLTQNEIVKKWEASHPGEKLTVTYGDLAEAEALLVKTGVENYWTDYPLFIQVEVAKGRGKLTHSTTPSSFAGKVTSVDEILAGPAWTTDGN